MMGLCWGRIGISEDSRMRRAVVLTGILIAAAAWAIQRDPGHPETFELGPSWSLSGVVMAQICI